METTRSLALLSILLLVPLVVGGNLVVTDHRKDVVCDVKSENETLVSDNGRLVRCLECQNVADSEDNSTDEVCICPEGKACYAKEKIGVSNEFEYFCKTKFDISKLNSGLFLDEDES